MNSKDWEAKSLVEGIYPPTPPPGSATVGYYTSLICKQIRVIVYNTRLQIFSQTSLAWKRI